MPTKSEQLVLEFMDCWVRLDLDGVMSRIAPDARYQSDPKADVVAGRDAIRELLASHIQIFSAFAFDVRNISGADKVAFLERTEHVTLLNGFQMALPIIGVFEFDDTSLIVAWRDYWDTAMIPSFGAD